jgi:hypothetical protein
MERFMFTRVIRNGVNCICVFFIFGSVALAGELTRGITFYASLDKSLTPERASGVSISKGEYIEAKGVVGSGCNSRGNMTYPFAANMSDKQGTLSFWVKLDKNVQDCGNGFRLFSTDQLCVMCMKNGIYYAKWYSKTVDGVLSSQWDYSMTLPVDAFPANQWLNVVLVWGATLKDGKISEMRRIYVNGKCIGKTQTSLSGDYGIETFSFSGEYFPAVYDEIVIWDRILVENEIKQVYKSPRGLADSLKAMPQITNGKQWIVYPELVYKQWNDSLISPGESFAIDQPLKNRTKESQKGKISFRVLDLWGNQVGKKQIKLFSIKADERLNVPVKFEVDRLGIFKVETTVYVEKGDMMDEGMRDVTTFACLPKGNPPKHPFFGGHINFDKDFPGLAEMGLRLGYSYNRCHNMTQYTWWSRCEPERGEWVWAWQTIYEKVNRMGYGHLGQWFGTPNWGVTNADGTHPDKLPISAYPTGALPTDKEAFENYIRKTIRHMPEIREWEIWNEPFFAFFFKGTPADYVRICSWAYPVAKATDPNLIIYAQIDNSLWSKTVLDKGLLKYCDALSYHWYAEPGQWDDAIRHIRSHKKILKKYTSKEIPLINSESGVSGSTFLRGLDFPELVPESKRGPMDYKLAADRMVQFYVTTMSEGVRAWYYYYHQPTGPEASYRGWNTTEITRTPRPFIVALAMLTWQLDGGNYVENRELVGPMYAYFFDRKDKTSLAVIWSEGGGLVDLKTEKSVQAFDMMNNEIKHDGTIRVDASPVYLRSKKNAKMFAEELSRVPVTVICKPENIAKDKEGVYVPKRMDVFSVASELGEKRLIPLDLRTVVNRDLSDDNLGDGVGGWTDEGELNDMRGLVPGNYTWLGVPMTIIDPKTNKNKAVLSMRGTSTFPGGPTMSDVIPIGYKTRGFFFLQAANYAQNITSTLGSYHIIYEDGGKEIVPVTVGKNVYDWWSDHQEGEESRTIPIKLENVMHADQPYRFLRLWYWANPRENAPVKSIQYVGQPNCHPVLVILGITAAIW